MQFSIRDLEINPGLILAPMEGVTDITFRRLVRSIGGCGLTVTEFIPAHGLHYDVKRAREMAEFDEEERPVSIQVYGRDAKLLAKAAAIVEELGADIVDLNMGCPSKKVCAHSGGSALMKEPDKVREIVSAMRAAVTIPFTVKMRSGWDPTDKNAPEIAHICQEEGAEAVAIHWRTREDKYGGIRELDTIATVKQRLGIPVIANGDIVDWPSARDTLAYTGCDGLMIGRGAIKNPWVFREIQRGFSGESDLEVALVERKDVLLDYFAEIRSRFRNDRGALGRFKKISNYFTRGLPMGTVLRQEIFHSQTVEEALERVEAHFSMVQTSGMPTKAADVA
jgi:tRNA-dihydrouridine synthase B